MRLDDAIMESNEDGKFSKYLLNQVPNIRKGIVQLMSIGLKKQEVSV